jgi:transposase
MQLIPRLADDEWQELAPLVRPNGPPRAIDDRSVVLALFLAVARNASLEKVAPELGLSGATLRTRRARWQKDGTLERLLAHGEGAIDRLRREHCTARLVPPSTLTPSQQALLWEMVEASQRRLANGGR